MYDEEHPESRAHAEQAASSTENALDFAFTGFVTLLEAAVRERVLAAYERPFQVCGAAPEHGKSKVLGHKAVRQIHVKP